MKKASLIFISIFFVKLGYSQEIHPPDEIFKKMSDSKISYEIKLFDKKIECVDYSDKLNYHDSYRVSNDSGLFTYALSPNEMAKPLFKKAENFFQLNNKDSALVYYQKCLSIDSTPMSLS